MKDNPLTTPTISGPPEVHMPELVEVALIDDNPLSANEEDTVTFKKLTEQMQSQGLIEIPVLARKPDGRYMLIAGKHRTDAFRHLGGAQIPAVIIDMPDTKEAEFNLVNNMNLIKGEMRKQSLVRIIKDHGLDPTKIDLLKMPSKLLIPTVVQEDIAAKNEELKRKARLNELALEISKQIAEQVHREKDEMLSLILFQDTITAIIRVPYKSKKIIRVKADDIKEKLTQALLDVESQEDLASD